ncbi:hypothetical protein P22_2395 [Propionispora sp. 2/2-37]|uniref:response regulator transcription factor n=1 Tax=Propionispora sp. 2/2-37 TaxID=1677858 RepID=UPI0006BB6F63|nr:response regulator [Propionispora sp. 2/2-37]CUH96305.1 hypothetical protein P22_2395 [Propionispora sp. 2/2-37]
MYKVLIADDEPIIRRGLRGLIDWKDLGLEVVGEAEDGEMALAQVQALQPDILLMDICMPFLSGLELAELLTQVAAKQCMVIVITGHDEFSYAQQAVRLHLFDYLLKPVCREHLLAVLNKAKGEIARSGDREHFLQWANQQMCRNLPAIKEQFFSDWTGGRLTEPGIKEQLSFFHLEYREPSGMIVIKIMEKINRDETVKQWDKQVLVFAVENIVNEILESSSGTMVFHDKSGHVIAITAITQMSVWLTYGAKIEAMVETYLKKTVFVAQKGIDGLAQVAVVYAGLLADINNKTNCTPIVMLTQKYIESNFYKEDLSLQEVADHMQISATYLSRLLKQETGLSFIDYLTHVRVSKAIQLMGDPGIKIYEIAERVGYSSQHYFSTAFKKAFGVSPVEYRKGRPQHC